VRDEFPAFLAAVAASPDRPPATPAPISAVAEHQCLEVVAFRHGTKYSRWSLVSQAAWMRLSPSTVGVEHISPSCVLELAGALHRQRYRIAFRSCAQGIPVHLVQQQIPDGRMARPEGEWRQ